MSKQWFRFYPGDYLRDTQLLTPEEHGCYMLMIMHYYSTGKPLPADRFVLSKIFKVSPQKTCKILSTISQLFVKKDGFDRAFFHACTTVNAGVRIDVVPRPFRFRLTGHDTFNGTYLDASAVT